MIQRIRIYSLQETITIIIVYLCGSHNTAEDYMHNIQKPRAHHNLCCNIHYPGLNVCDMRREFNNI